MSTARRANNPYIKRYVEPDDGVLGRNQYGNHWNKASANKCVHAFIGKAADGSVRVYQTLPWDMRCWGIGKGRKGSYNASHIQFEICEDGMANRAYYEKAFGLAKELCAFLCRQYGISPDSIVGHYEAAAGYGSNHGDPRNWQRKFGDSMDKFRADVKTLLGGQNGPVDVTEGKPEQTPAQPGGIAQGGNPGQSGASEVIAMKTLRNGSRGTQVKVLQWLLNENGYNAGKVDGIFGKNTLNAVKAYQKAHGLSVDGIAGKNTWTKLLA